jgi:hypothetical protein
MTQASDGIDPALADAIDSIKATHEDEFPRGEEPDAATDADAVSGVPVSDGADAATYRTSPDADTPDSPTGAHHG